MRSRRSKLGKPRRVKLGEDIGERNLEFEPDTVFNRLERSLDRQLTCQPSKVRVDMAVKKQFGSFQDLLADSEVPVLVDFYEPWCGPCQMMAPILEQVNEQLKQQLRIVKINTGNYPKLGTKYHISALPTLVLFKNGQPVDRIEGVMGADRLIPRLQSFLR